MAIRFHCIGFIVLCACSDSNVESTAVRDAPLGASDAARITLDAQNSGVSCTRATECPVGTVCDPISSMCAAHLVCTTHSDCGGEAYCATGGMCAPSLLHGPCDTTANCVGTETCVSGHCGCGGEPLQATAVAPNMLIALDRSSSMVEFPVPGANANRWEVAKRVIQHLTQRYQAEIRFGLTLWPGTTRSCDRPPKQTLCAGLERAVALGPLQSTAIVDALATSGTCSLGTPIGGTLDALVTDPALADTEHDNYVVLVTDGGENCQGDGAAAATALRARSPEVKTFVVGFGGDVDATLLTRIAENGGTARATPPRYYKADDEATLLAAFENIAGSIVPCSYTLSSAPTAATLYVFLGDQQILHDTTHRGGWDYDGATTRLTFYGASCTQVRSTGAEKLVVTYGCRVDP